MPQLSTFIFSADFIQKLESDPTQNILREHNRLASDFKIKESAIHGLEEGDEVDAYGAAKAEQALFFQENQKILEFLMNKDKQLTNLNKEKKNLLFTLDSCKYNLNLSYFRCIFLLTSFKEYEPPKAVNLKKMIDQDMFVPFNISSTDMCSIISIACTITGIFPFILAAAGTITLASALWFTPLLVIAAISLIAAFVLVHDMKKTAHNIQNDTTEQLNTNEAAIKQLFPPSSTIYAARSVCQNAFANLRRPGRPSRAPWMALCVFANAFWQIDLAYSEFPRREFLAIKDLVHQLNNGPTFFNTKDLNTSPNTPISSMHSTL